MSKKLFISAALALVALLAVTASAAAFTASVSPAGEITSTTSAAEFIGGSTTIRCPLTLRGSLNSSVTLTAGQSLGRITRIEIGACSGGNSVSVLNLPYELPYTSTEGTLPNEATEVNFNVRGASFNLGLFGNFVNCLYSGDQPSILTLSGTNPYTTGGIETEPTPLRLVRGGFGCPSTGSMRASFSLSPSQRITVS
jgi:hypothetical protein